MYIHSSFVSPKRVKFEPGKEFMYITGGKGQRFTLATGKIAQVLPNGAIIFTLDQIYRKSDDQPHLLPGMEISVGRDDLWVKQPVASGREMASYEYYGLDLRVPVEFAVVGKGLIMPTGEVYVVEKVEDGVLKLRPYKENLHSQIKIGDVQHFYGVAFYTMRIKF